MEMNTGTITLCEPSITACFLSIPLSRFFCTASLTTIALSTSIPSTTISAASDTNWISRPKSFMPIKFAKIASGMAKLTTKAFLKFMPTIITIITSTMDSIRFIIKSFTDFSTSSDCKAIGLNKILSGKVFVYSAITLSTLLPTSTVLRPSVKYTPITVAFCLL